MPKPDYDAWSAACLGGAAPKAPAACAAASAKILTESKWEGQNQYALSYPACHEAAATTTAGAAVPGLGGFDPVASPGAVAQRRWLWARGMGASAAATAGEGNNSTADLVYDPCVDNYGVAYLNRADVQAAIHVNASAAASGQLPVRWSECSYALDYSPSDGLVPMMPTYLAILSDPCVL